MILKEWRCDKHGSFESSHAICPAMGCRSEKVEREFLTPPHIGTQFVKRHEQGIKKLADAYGQTDFKTAREGESSKARSTPVGQELLWGNDVQKKLGVGMDALTAATAVPFSVARKDGTRETVPHGMRLAATDLGLTQRVLPPAGELTVSKHEQKMTRMTQAVAGAFK